jgi:tetratricopeptide (TPR) repeat protein
MTEMTPNPGESDNFSRPIGKRLHHTYIWGSEIPFRNPHFTGREAELRTLREQLQTDGSAVIRQPPTALYGLGGVGKTQIATEYAHRYAEDYEVVWWVRSDQEDSIQASLVGLGVRLRVPDVTPGDRDRSLRLVIDALQSGDPYSRWLLIFDDVTQPNKLRRYIPQGGHVIVTSRISEWRQVLNTDGIEVREFARADTVKFLRERVPQLVRNSDDPAAEAAAAAAADRLADVLGDLPLAAEHAASYLSQTGSPVSAYIEAFERDAHSLFGQDADMFATNLAVATTWSVARLSLSPEARELFQLMAFFAAEPIPEENLIQPGRVALDPELPAPVQKVLSSRTELKRAQRELARFSFISVYGQRNVAQLHRVVQAVTRARIEKESPDLANTLRQTVFALLAATDPEGPEREQNDPIYERTIRHLLPTGALESENKLLRNLIINQVRRLRMRGGNREALSLGEAALEHWESDPNDIQTLAMAVEIAIAKRSLGQLEEAFALNADTLQRLRDHHGEDEETYLICANSYGADLRRHGRYEDALAHDLSLLPAYDRVFSPGQFRPLSLRNNIAIDLRCVGQYQEALEYDTLVAADRERYFGANDLRTASSKFGVAQDLRRLGRYEEALEVSREIVDLMEARNEPWNFDRLLIYGALAVSLRRVGFYVEAHELAEDVYRRYVEYAGEEHRATLLMATNLMCDRRVVDELVQASELGEATVMAWEKVAGQGHPNTLNARANLAVILRMRGYPAAAQEMNQAALEGLSRLYSYHHPMMLMVMTNLASDLAAVGDVRQARQIGEEVVAKSQDTRGSRHPVTLAASANLALDLRAAGERDAAHDLESQTLAVYDEVLTPEHPQTRRARQQGRVNVDIEPATP